MLNIKDLCVENNTIFTQMLQNKRLFVARTIQYLHRCFKTKDPLFGCQNCGRGPDSLLLMWILTSFIVLMVFFNQDCFELLWALVASKLGQYFKIFENLDFDIGSY